MQQRLRRDAADIQAHAAQRGVLLDQHHLLAEIGGAERGGVAAGAGAEHHHFGVDVAFDEVCRDVQLVGRGSFLCRRWGLLRFGFECGCSLAAFQHQNHIAFAYLVADLDLEFLHDAGNGRGHFHRRLVGFQRDQRLLRRRRVAGLDQHFDDGDIFEIADVRYFDFDGLAHGLLQVFWFVIPDQARTTY